MVMEAATAMAVTGTVAMDMEVIAIMDITTAVMVTDTDITTATIAGNPVA